MNIFKPKGLPKLNEDIDPKQKGIMEQNIKSKAPSFSIPFEILGESINPLDPSAPYVLQGTFIQISNVGSSVVLLNIFFRSSTRFPFPTRVGNVEFAANYVDQASEIFDVTTFVATTGSTPVLRVDAGRTVIVGLEYVFAPPSGDAATATEAAGNRGFAVPTVFTSPGTNNLLITTTIRQTFATYGATPTVISASAYAVPNYPGPLYSA